MSESTSYSMKPAPVLPQELADQIIGYLRHDSMSLKQCSLVCRSWLASSRTHQFRTLSFNAINAVILTSLIIQPSVPTIIPYVKRLEFQEAHLFFMKISPMSFLHRFSGTLTQIHISNTFLDSFGSLINIICTFPLLHSIFLEHVAWNGSCSTNQARLVNRWLSNSVTQLRLKHTPLSQITVWLQLHSTLPTPLRLTDLDIGPIEEHEVPLVGRFFLVAGPSVENISLSFGLSETGYMHICAYEPSLPKGKVGTKSANASEFYSATYGVPACSYMAAFTALNTLRIDGFLDSSATEQTTALFWTPRILASAKSPNVSRIVLQVKTDSTGDLDRPSVCVKWDFIDQVLMTEAYAHLQSLEFEIVGRVDLDSMGSLIMRRLPMLARRGVLRFYKS
ncbi:hypothetical protein CPC08DRAFT_235376 [Agrocybe pediades]|nr:hypothetical protein CPC08DRAFT_235376 [Agrocybe pediades]